MILLDTGFSLSLDKKMLSVCSETFHWSLNKNTHSELYLTLDTSFLFKQKGLVRGFSGGRRGQTFSLWFLPLNGTMLNNNNLKEGSDTPLRNTLLTHLPGSIVFFFFL